MSTFTNFIKDSFWTIGAQGVSLLTSIIVSFILPKFISVEQFGYWQYFLLWTSYVGVMHFGYGDGIYLKLGGQYWSQIDRKEWMPQLQLTFILQLIIGIIIAIASFTLCTNEKYLIIFLWTAAYLIIENTYKIITMAMMATDQIPFVSKTVIIDKLLMSAIVVYLIINQCKEASYVMCAYTLAHFVACIMSIVKSGLFCKLQLPTKLHAIKMIDTCKIGMILMLANFAAILIMGICRLAVEHYWNIEVFSQLSFSITIASFLLFFISQIGYVLFPVLKRIKEEIQALLLEKADYMMTILPMVFYALFFAMYFFVLAWLPKYENSLRFLAFTAPCICYETRVVLLYNTYFKNLGKIKQLLYINIITVICAIICYSIAIFKHNIDMMALGILIAEIIKVFMMQKELYKSYTIPIKNITKIEFINTIGFVFCYYYHGIYITMIWYAIIMAILMLFFKKETITFVKFIKKIR